MPIARLEGKGTLMDKITPARISVLSNRGRIGKSFNVSPDGSLEKTPNGQFTDGTIEAADVASAASLAKLCEGLTPNQALCLGGPKTGDLKANITTRKNAVARSQSGRLPLTRTKDDLDFFPGQGYALLDFDDKDLPEEQRARISKTGGAEEVIYGLHPELRSIDRMIRPSSSAGLFIPNSNRPALGGGFHMFVRLCHGAYAPRLLEAIKQHSCSAGFGYVAFSKSGAMLERFVVDASVASPERLIFTADPILGPGVARAQIRTQVFEGDPLDSPTMSCDLSWSRNRCLAFENAREPAEKLQTAYLRQHAKMLSDQSDIALTAATEQVEALIRSSVLRDDFVIELSDGRDLRVRDILKSARPGMKLSCADPIEGRSYGRTTASILWGPGHGDPVLISHAHGQKTVFRFARYDLNTLLQNLLP